MNKEISNQQSEQEPLKLTSRGRKVLAYLGLVAAVGVGAAGLEANEKIQAEEEIAHQLIVSEPIYEVADAGEGVDKLIHDAIEEYGTDDNTDYFDRQEFYEANPGVDRTTGLQLNHAYQVGERMVSFNSLSDYENYLNSDEAESINVDWGTVVHINDGDIRKSIINPIVLETDDNDYVMAYAEVDPQSWRINLTEITDSMISSIEYDNPEGVPEPQLSKFEVVHQELEHTDANLFIQATTGGEISLPYVAGAVLDQ